MRPITIVLERERWLICLKPPRMLTVKAPKGKRKGEITLVERLRQEGRALLAVHRLDQETTGLVLMAKDAAAKDALMALFKKREVKKCYSAVVQGRLPKEHGVFEDPIEDRGSFALISRRGQKAKTSYSVIERFPAATLVEAVPHTGRHNQIRLHFAHAGHPLVGERKYAFGKDARVRHKRAALHAGALAFRCPFSDESIEAQAALPPDLQNLLARLRV